MAVAGFLFLVALPVHAADVLLPDKDCVDYGKRLGYSELDTEAQCPKFYYRGAYVRDKAQYFAYRECVQKCTMEGYYKHVYLCATQDCRGFSEEVRR